MQPNISKDFLIRVGCCGGLMLLGLAALLVWYWQPRTLVYHRAPVTSLVVSADGQLLVAAGGDGRISYWQPARASLVQGVRAHTDWIFGLALAPDGQQVASAAWDGRVRLWQTDHRRPVQTLAGSSALYWRVAFSSSGSLVAAAADDGTVQV